MASRRAGIAGIGAFAPEKVLTNADLEKMVDTSDEWISTRTGIKERRILAQGQSTSDLGVAAARQALKRAGLQPEDLQLIITATATPDMPFPATGCIIQEKLGAVNAAAFDLQAGCSGFVYALSVATQFVENGAYDRVLVVGADSLTRVTDWTDRNTCVLFGDGGGAAVVMPAQNGNGVLGFHLGADGTGQELLKINAGGSRHPANHDTVDQKLHYIQMAGSEVFKFASKIIEEASRKVLEKAHLTVEDVDLFVPHQANLRIIESAAKRLKIPKEKVFVNVQRYGNTSCGSIPLALNDALAEGRLEAGKVVVLVGFGAGLTWAASAIRWDKMKNGNGA